MSSASLPKAFTDWSWQEYAACKDQPPALWLYPTSGYQGPEAIQRRQLAVSFCNVCPVKKECEVAGAEAPGIWGGLSERERDLARAARNRRRRENRPLTGSGHVLNRDRHIGPCQEAYRLYTEEKLTYEAIAKIQFCDPSTVYRRIRAEREFLATQAPVD